MIRARFSPDRYQEQLLDGQRVTIRMATSTSKKSGFQVLSIDMAEPNIMRQAPRNELSFPAIICRSHQPNLLWCYLPRHHLPSSFNQQIKAENRWKIEGYYRIPDRLCRLLHLPAGSRLCGRPYIPLSVGSGHWSFKLQYR